jgi:hypothetical protein
MPTRFSVALIASDALAFAKARVHHSSPLGLFRTSVLSLLFILPSCVSVKENLQTKVTNVSEQDSRADHHREAIHTVNDDNTAELTESLLRRVDFGKIGYIDRSGNLAIKPSFYGAGDFAPNGLAPVDVDPATIKSPSLTRWGYINTKGDLTIPVQFNKAGEFGDNGLAIVQRNDNTYDFIDSHGRFKTFQHFQEVLARRGMHDALQPVAYSYRLSPARVNGKWGYIGTQGQWVISPRFDGADEFHAFGLAAIRLGDQWGYINLNGKIVIPPIYERFAGAFSRNGLASVYLGGKCGFINRLGAIVVPPRYLKCGDFGYRNIVWVSIDDERAALIDAKGHFVREPSSDEVNEGGFSANGLAAFAQDSGAKKLWGYIDALGNVVIRPQFLFAEEFTDNGLASVVNGESESGYINSRGVFVIPANLDVACEFAPDGLARVARNGRWGFINSSGKIVIWSRYLPVTDFSRSGYAQVSSNEGRPERINCWGLIE